MTLEKGTFISSKQVKLRLTTTSRAKNYLVKLEDGVVGVVRVDGVDGVDGVVRVDGVVGVVGVDGVF